MMQQERHAAKIWIPVFAVFAALLVYGCSPAAADPAATPSPTPVPEVISIGVVDLNENEFETVP